MQINDIFKKDLLFFMFIDMFKKNYYCETVSKAVSADTTDTQFESSH